ncbi:MAG: carboxylating nicotinate-nucleotide diphosphorylase [Planctomycetes bacterium]|nr:carboxylating nicotinate-nucleotide diphosphorylase [Planctomycetota bacterium]
MAVEFTQIEWDRDLDEVCRRLVELALREDLDAGRDWTSEALIADDLQGQASMVARSAGVAAGLRALAAMLEHVGAGVEFLPAIDDGRSFERGASIATVRGRVRGILVHERWMLNTVSRLCGIATLAREFVRAVEGLPARIYDTRKTTPGWRRLEKYAVRCGGGRNHRTGLFDAFLIKDNHLAFAGWAGEPERAIERVRAFAADSERRRPEWHRMPIEIEVDSLDAFRRVLPTAPDLVLLDNMPVESLAQAVALRDQLGSPIELEASGGVTIATVRAIARTGVDRISVGSLTHGAVSLDIGLDWSA